MDNDRREEERGHHSKYTDAHSYNYANNNTEEIGKTFVSHRHQNTIDSFWFAVKADIIVKPFDYVTVEQSNYKTIGIIQYIQRIAGDPDYTLDDKQSSGSTNHKQKKKEKKNLFNVLDLQIKPFNNVTYLLPRGKDGKPNSLPTRKCKNLLL